MNAKHLLFKTARFNLSEVKLHFINPCCFGEDAAAWMKQKLMERSVTVQAGDPGQEDWGWYIRAEYSNGKYLLGFGGNLDEAAQIPNTGEWRIIVNKRRSIKDCLTGKAKIQYDDPMLLLVEEILRGEPDFTGVNRDPDPDGRYAHK